MDLTNLPDLDTLSPAKQKELLRLLIKQQELNKREKARTSFIEFIHRVWPGFIHGRHHEIMAEAFERVAQGKLKRLIINMPPRHTKSEFASIHLPAWYLGLHPDRKIIQASNTAELAIGFGRKVRDLVQSPDFKTIFPGVELKSDTKAAGRWNTSLKGEYYAIGVEGAVTGKGADLFIIDDPHSEQEAALADYNPEIYDKVYNWYTSGPRQRLQPGAAIVIVMTRWGLRDLTARVLKAQLEKEGSDTWEVIELPAIMPSGLPLWPEYWSIKELNALKAELPLSKWSAQYQQDPTSDISALIKREWWQPWERTKPPECELIMSSIDTAYGKTDRSNYTACTTWGIFNRTDDSGDLVPSIILLDAWRDKISFPALKKRVKEHYEEFEPEILLIETKAVGQPLIYELRSMGIPVQEFNPVRGNDKITRVNSVTDIFASGNVYAPLNKGWAQDVIEECAAFPTGTNDDYVDTVSQALIRYRQGGWVNNKLDDWGTPVKRRKRVYY